MKRSVVSGMRATGCLLVVIVAGACNFDRERPSPVEPDVQAALSVLILEPRDGSVALTGRDLTVKVEARDLSGSRLAGVGFVARRSGSGGNATLDSVALGVDQTNEATREFTFAVPATLPANTQVDIFGIAYGPRTQTRVSVPSSITVARCDPGQPGC